MPHLIDAGVKAIHPFEERCNGGLDKLVNEYGQDVVFMGGMDIEEISKDRDPMGILKKKIDTVKKDSFYIYQAGHPIMPNISFKDYNITLDTLKNCGRY